MSVNHTLVRRLVPAVALAALVASSAACDPDSTTLSGSLSQVYNIHFESVRARLYASELSIEYVDRYSAVPVRLTLRLADVQPTADHDYDLFQVGDITGRTPDDAEIPRFTTGKLSLGAYSPEPGAEVAGSFDAKFETGRDALTLSGEFKTELEVVDPI